LDDFAAADANNSHVLATTAKRDAVGTRKINAPGNIATYAVAVSAAIGARGGARQLSNRIDDNSALNSKKIARTNAGVAVKQEERFQR